MIDKVYPIKKASPKCKHIKPDASGNLAGFPWLMVKRAGPIYQYKSEALKGKMVCSISLAFQCFGSFITLSAFPVLVNRFYRVAVLIVRFRKRQKRGIMPRIKV